MKSPLVYFFILFLSYPSLTIAKQPNTKSNNPQNNATLTQSISQKELSDVQDKETPPFFSNFQVLLGLNAGGPILFKDTADGTLNNTTYFMLGGNLEFLFGHYKRHNHRVGLGLSYDLIAESNNRNLAFFKTYLTYQTGFPFNLEFHLGGNIAAGDPDFAANYTGLYSGIVLKYNFVTEEHKKHSTSLGLKGEFILTPNDMEYNSAFLGVVFEYVFRTDKF